MKANLNVLSWLIALSSGLTEKHQGQVATVIGGLVVGVVMLFVGLFLISVVADVGTDYYLENAYQTLSDTDDLAINSTDNGTHTFNVTNVQASTGANLIVVWTNYSATAGGIDVIFNGVNETTIQIPPSTDPPVTTTITGLTATADDTNNLTFHVNVSSANITIDSSGLRYSHDTQRTTMGTIQENLTATTGTIFTVLGLVIIVIALATAINSLRGVTKE